MQPNPCDIADQYTSKMYCQYDVLKLETFPDEIPPKADTVVMTHDALAAAPDEFLRYKVGRLLIVVGGPVSDLLHTEKLKLYSLYYKKPTFTVYSRNRPSLLQG